MTEQHPTAPDAESPFAAPARRYLEEGDVITACKFLAEIAPAELHHPATRALALRVSGTLNIIAAHGRELAEIRERMKPHAHSAPQFQTLKARRVTLSVSALDELGHTKQAIALLLKVAVSTVKTHLRIAAAERRGAAAEQERTRWH